MTGSSFFSRSKTLLQVLFALVIIGILFLSAFGYGIAATTGGVHYGPLHSKVLWEKSSYSNGSALAQGEKQLGSDCPLPPECGPDEHTCSIRVEDGCITWDCCSDEER